MWTNNYVSNVLQRLKSKQTSVMFTRNKETHSSQHKELASEKDYHRRFKDVWTTERFRDSVFYHRYENSKIQVQ